MENNNRANHKEKQLKLFIGLLYFLTVAGVSIWLAFWENPFTYFIQNLLANDKGMYPVKAAFLLQFICILAAFFPFYFLAGKLVDRKKSSGELYESSELNEQKKKEFSFEYYAAVSTIAMDDLNMQVKIGFVNKVFPLSSLRYFYEIRKNTYSTFYLAYEDSSGKLKKLPCNAEAGDVQLRALVEELEKKFPEKSLQNLSQREALKTMQAMNPALMAGIIIFVVLLIIAFVVMWSMGI